ncbi:hypothetical protein C8R47DRAFT_1290918 [Mycena vitilis]|nr:hypothetical protein C8R47DRAFT_1290918 [Mycena vitilis]
MSTPLRQRKLEMPAMRGESIGNVNSLGELLKSDTNLRVTVPVLFRALREVRMAQGWHSEDGIQNAPVGPEHCRVPQEFATPEDPMANDTAVPTLVVGHCVGETTSTELQTDDALSMVFMWGSATKIDRSFMFLSRMAPGGPSLRGSQHGEQTMPFSCLYMTGRYRRSWPAPPTATGIRYAELAVVALELLWSLDAPLWNVAGEPNLVPVLLTLGYPAFKPGPGEFGALVLGHCQIEDPHSPSSIWPITWNLSILLSFAT